MDPVLRAAEKEREPGSFLMTHIKVTKAISEMNLQAHFQAFPLKSGEIILHQRISKN